MLGDAAYGDCTEFRGELTQRGLTYLLAVPSSLVVWKPGTGPERPPPRKPGRSGRTPKKYTDGRHKPVSIGDLSQKIGRRAYSKVTWREGSRGMQASYFATLRVRTAHGHTRGLPPGEEQWLLCEWPKDEQQPTKFYLSTLPENARVKKLVRFAKLRWRVERDYQEMKGEVGLDHFEGRTWLGFHHHVALCAVAHGFLALRRALFPPEGRALDTPHGSTRSAADTAEEDRDLPAVPSAVRAAGRRGAVTHVIGQ